MKKRVLFSIIMILLIIPCTIFAFDEGIAGEITPTPPGEIANMTNTILGVIQWVGYGIAIGMLLYVGIKYTMSAANEKANLKQTLINYLIGAFVLFAAVTIFTACINLFGGETESKGETINKPETNQTTDTPVIGG